MLLECKRCGYVWNYKGKNKYYATCPRCLAKVNVKTSRVRKDAEV